MLTKLKDELGKERISRDTEKARFLVEAQKWEAEMKDVKLNMKKNEINVQQVWAQWYGIRNCWIHLLRY